MKASSHFRIPVESTSQRPASSSADRLVPGERNEAGNPLIEQYIPARFNAATELEATIDRSQRLDWRLPGDG
jgi:hypothetical protein